MFFKPGQHQRHELPHDPLKALVQPRPIGWISSLSTKGVANLAPYSFFNLIADFPPYVFFGSAMKKDSQRNIEETKEFVCNMATWDLREAMNQSSAHLDRDVDEFELVGLEKAPSRWVAPPRVKDSPAALECKYLKTVRLPGDDVREDLQSEDGSHFFSIVIGRVVGVYVAEAALTEGMFDASKVRPISRGGYMEYAVADSIFTMGRPD